jgi:hypothetical protein
VQRRTISSSSLVVWATWLLSACTTASLGSVGEDSGTSTGAQTGDVDSASCRTAADCDDGVCDNGVCVSSCEHAEDCPAGHDCSEASLCQPNNVPTCTLAEDCVAGQICLYGYCSTPPSGVCDPHALDDGCGPRALCFERFDDDDVGDCYSMPACASDGSCPVGALGAVCNDGYLFNKDRICIISACVEPIHCPETFSCVSSGAVLGVCSDGSFGAPCTDPSHCTSNACNVLPGVGGYCS